MKNILRVVSLAIPVFIAPGSAIGGALEDYVKRPDANYAWSMYDDSWGVLANYYFLRLRSQQWLDATRVDRPLWEHEIRIAQPRPQLCGESAKSKTAIIIVSGGGNRPDGSMGNTVSWSNSLLAHAFCRTIVELKQVPNQPIVFTDETASRKEDGIIAYTFDRYLRGVEGDWPVQLAMVRSVVQAMTAIQEFSRTQDNIPDIEDFVLVGASKRGWTTWLTAAVDPRVRAIVPVSIDMPGIAQQFPHMLAAYGEFSPALKDYTAFDIGCRMAGPRGRDLMGIIDPIAYRERLKMPKLILNSAGDQFFVSDSWRFYYDDLMGDKRLRYTVNSDHGHSDGSGSKNAKAFTRFKLLLQARNWINDVLDGREPPHLDWQRTPEQLVVQPSAEPRTMKLWTADNPVARDFRLATLGPAWKSQTLEADADGKYRVNLQSPQRGWRAVMVEAVFGGFTELNQQVYTTGVYVLPDTLPFASAPACADKAVALKGGASNSAHAASMSQKP
ncbi:MAG TPA: PhoPQ-activated protein PqaA family protein [Verrucomicrobiae bacterium]|nr:PhoPQ-activated protein PqaA family protein [Verrucomicrobiae bacterium]